MARKKNEKSLLITPFSVKQIVQEVRTDPRTIAACPGCKKPFAENEKTVLVEVVRFIPLIEPPHDKKECAVRIHFCFQCTENIVLEKREATKGLIDWLVDESLQS